VLKPAQIQILNTFIHNLSMNETLSIINDTIVNEESIQHVVVNAGKIVQIQKDEQLRESVNNSDIINADGQAVVWAAKFLNKPLKERVTGIDLMENLVELAYKNNHKIFLFGAKEEVVKEVVTIYTKKYNKNLIAGYRNGYYNKEDEASIAKEIASSGANMLFVAITSPKKENFLYEFKNELKAVNFIMGVGGSFDVIAALTKRAPIWMQNNGLEWFYRFIQEPKRMWKRYLVGNSKFIYLVFKQKLNK
jgi:N-acetylglucosaminyldiphosphoundecaprenol N-acetyl-beta-D-mannosaminyltransferase